MNGTCKLNLLLCLAVFFVSGWSATFSSAQLVEPRWGAPLNSNGQSIFGSKASLKTDPELESILEKAERFRKEKQYNISSKLWQSVLERSGDALYSEDDEVFYSLSQQVEQIIAGLPENDGLSVYRITADAGAKEIMAAADGPFDVRALQQVVRKYFVSSLGDDAALTLSSIYMDDYDFVGAIRMLRKIADQYPDPSVSMVDVFGRLAVCQALMGEPKQAQLALETAISLPADSQSAKLPDIESLIAGDNPVTLRTNNEVGFKSVLANRNRSGVMPALPSGILNNELTTVWQYHYPASAKSWADVERSKPIFGSDAVKKIAKTVKSKETQMIEKWRARQWRPTGNLLFDGGRVYFKTMFDLTVWDSSADNDKALWRPAWQNEFKMDDYTAAMMEVRRTFNRRGRVKVETSGHDSPAEVQLFADAVSSQLSIQDGILYTIEGTVKGPPMFNGAQRTSRQQRLRYNLPRRRSRTNRLTAYDAQSGRTLWTLPPPLDDAEKNDQQPIVADGEYEPEWLSSGGFMGAPIHYAGLAIVAVNHGGAISAYALDPKQDGKTVWNSYLCDESSLGANPNAPVNLSINGSDLFATCGLGVVFILDPTTGLIRMARRYQRQPVNLSIARGGNQGVNYTNFDSWSTDTIFSYGRQMVCFSSDARTIECFDRNSGSVIWRGMTKPLHDRVDYLLGVYDGILYTAGPSTILAFNLKDEGYMIWGGSPLFDGKTSYGRGMLTPDGIYVPVDDEIYKFSLLGKNGKAELVGKTTVELGTGAPVGNLYSDGLKIWVLGANRVHALGAKLANDSSDNDRTGD